MEHDSPSAYFAEVNNFRENATLSYQNEASQFSNEESLI